MMRELREVINLDGGRVLADNSNNTGGAFLVFWAALVITLSLISVIIFSCANGVSKEKASASDTQYYGGGCATECGTACGG
ncbi:hypothetical protein I3842_15G119700 [Carya illinoinensis]|uniref:Uncharacterized protein n=1 Tax=Carya illinoinensis TaxID=32201 RepID=A0A922A6D7_CARIL|nr:hypothetical protein I3842_15G119700 [Carya illinoinensis]